MRRILLWFCLAFLLVIPHISNAQIYDSPDLSIRVTSVAWSSDGTRIAASFADSTVRVWEFNGETELDIPFLTFHPDLTDKVEWTPDGSYLVVQGTHGTEDGLLRAEATKWDAETGEQVETLLDYRLDTAFEFNFFAYNTYPVIGFDSTFEQAAFSFNKLKVTFSNGYNVISVGDQDSDLTHYVQNIIWSSDDSQIAVIYGNVDHYYIQTFEVETSELINTIWGPDYYVSEIEWNADSPQIAVSSVWASGPSAQIRVYTVSPANDYLASEDRLWVFDDTSYAPIAWHPHENLLAMASPQDIQIFDPTVEEPIATISQEGVIRLDWSPNGQYLAGGLIDGTIHIFPVP